MKTIFTYIFKRKKLVFIALLFFLIQLPFLDQLSLLRGERDIVLTGWSLARTGHDLYGRFLPLEFIGIDPNVPFVPMYLTALWWLIIPFKSVFTARLFFVLISITIPFLIFEIIKYIKKDSTIAYITSILFCFSPGVFYLTRLTLEIGIAFPLLLAGILFYLRKTRIFSLLFFFLAFFSYHGFRPLIPILLIYLEFFHFIKNEQSKVKIFFKNLLLIVAFSIFLLGFSIKIDGHLMKNRANDLIFFNFTQLSNQIDYRRNTSSAPKVVSNIFDNKLTDLAMYIKDNFFGGIGFEYLFRNGDPSSLYATTFSGQFFLTYLVLLILGFAYLGKKGAKIDIYILGWVVIGLIPSLANISYPSYSIRAMLSSVGYAYLFGLGLIYLRTYLINNSKWTRICILSLLGFALIIEIVYLGYNFYFRRYITMSQMYFETERSLPLYLNKNIKPYKIYVSSPRDMFFGYAFFNNTLDFKLVQKTVQRGEPYVYSGLEFKQCNQTYQKRHVIISDSCLTEAAYKKLFDSKVERMNYTNYSFRSAFFIID